MKNQKSTLGQPGFTLIELLVVIAIVGLLASIVLVGLNIARVKARDTQRVANIQQIMKALEFYYNTNARYPAVTAPFGVGGWETSSADPAQWLEALAPYFGGKTPADPINRAVEPSMFGPRAGDYYFAYYRYDPPAYCACNTSSLTCVDVRKPIGVLVIRNLEQMAPADLPLSGMPLPLSIALPRAVCGESGADGVCTQAEYLAGQCRDWSQEFDYSLLLIE
ncbi:MAG: prepilin-type N-terminal cleavage/methylation domain-containing protein [Patescibacteria group bacterium]